MQEQFNKVREACLRVKRNCQGFNVAEELCMFVNFLKNDMSSLRSQSVVRKATKFVDKLEALSDDLQNDDSLISIIEQPISSTTNLSISPPIATKRKTLNNNNNSNPNGSKQASKVCQPQPTSVSSITIILTQLINFLFLII